MQDDRMLPRTLVLMAAYATLCIGASSAQANDSTAELTTGGLVFSTNANIEMRSEELAISRKRIDVRYRFFNRSGVDQTVLVAFPMPEVQASESDVGVPDAESDNFLQFKTVADGRPVVARIEQKAFAGGKDVTERLRQLNIPLQPLTRKTRATLDALPKGVEAELLHAELARPDDYDAGKGMEHHLAPLWSLKTTYYWEQTFPANREIVIEHSYVPSVGGSVQTSLGASYATEADLKNYATRYCTEKSFIGSVAAMAKKRGAPPPEFRIAYVLKTGANWAGPIGDFRLTVDKGDPSALVSFCETGVAKISPTTFEVRKRDFTPARDLDILIIDGSPQ